MSKERQALGNWGEDRACGYLRRQGMRILHRNYRTPVGELDIVARLKTLLVFVEVKTRRGTAFGTPQEAVGATKQRQIIRTAQWYMLQEKCENLQPRFDVVAILCQSDEKEHILHLPNAFELSE